MVIMNSNDNQNDFAIIHVRPGLEGKTQPVGTVAVNLESVKSGLLVAGYAIQHSKLDKWDASRGRMVAVGRAARGRDSMLCQPVDPKLGRRELLISALQLIVSNEDMLNLSRDFRSSTRDTLSRLLAAKASADLKNASGAL
jgi:hypothetical protein